MKKKNWNLNDENPIKEEMDLIVNNQNINESDILKSNNIFGVKIFYSNDKIIDINIIVEFFLNPEYNPYDCDIYFKELNNSFHGLNLSEIIKIVPSENAVIMHEQLNVLLNQMKKIKIKFGKGKTDKILLSNTSETDVFIESYINNINIKKTNIEMCGTFKDSSNSKKWFIHEIILNNEKL